MMAMLIVHVSARPVTGLYKMRYYVISESIKLQV